MSQCNVVFLGHTGLGDAFVQKGIVRKLAGAARQVEVVAYRKYLQSMEDVYADIPNCKFLLINQVEDISPAYGGKDTLLKARLAAGDTVVALGWHSGIRNWDQADPSWANCLYRQVGLEPRLMYDLFGSVRTDSQRNAGLHRAAVAAVGERYAVIHDDPSREMAISRERIATSLPLIHVDDPRIYSSRITDYFDLLSSAQEMHFIDSAMAHFANFCIKPPAERQQKRLVYRVSNRVTVDSLFPSFRVI
jgi:hypothetical protein